MSSTAHLERPTEPDPATFLLADEDLRAVLSFDGRVTWLDERWEEAGFDRAAMRLNAPADHEGTGIGLSICETVVERHGGRIWIEASPLGGIRFVIAVPARAAAA